MRRRVRRHLSDQNTLALFHVERFRQLGREGLDHDTHVAAAAAENGGFYTHHLTIQVYQRSARVAGIDGSIGLNEILLVTDAEAGSTLGADRAHGQSMAQSERIAQGHAPFAHLEGGRVTPSQCRQTTGLYFDHGHTSR